MLGCCWSCSLESDVRACMRACVVPLLRYVCVCVCVRARVVVVVLLLLAANARSWSCESERLELLATP